MFYAYTNDIVQITIVTYCSDFFFLQNKIAFLKMCPFFCVSVADFSVSFSHLSVQSYPHSVLPGCLSALAFSLDLPLEFSRAQAEAVLVS